MKAYGEVAVRAAELIRSYSVESVTEAWNTTASAVFLHSSSLQEKGCPRSAFLGLCEKGLVSGVPAAPDGVYTRSVANKEYAVKAVQLLKQNAALATIKPEELWELVMSGVDKKHNSQMDVVLGLWQQGLIL